MSGIEIIGLILGGIPLVISAAEHYKEGFEPFLKWHRFKREFRGFVNSIDLEKRMFDGLLDRLLRYTDLPLEQKAMLLTDPYQGWDRESTGKALKLRLGDSYRSCMYILETMKEDMLKLQTMMSLKDGSVDWAKPGEDKWNYQRKRISQSFSKKGLETVSSLEKNNRKFRELLDLLDSKLTDDKVDRRKMIIKDTSWAKIFECIRRHASSLHWALKNGWNCSCEVPHLGALQLQERATSDWSSQFTMIFDGHQKAQTPLRKIKITVKEEQTYKITMPQPTPVQEWYLDKLTDNLETKSSPKANSAGSPPTTNAHSHSSSISTLSSIAHSKLAGRFSKNESVVTVSTIQNGNRTLVLEDAANKTLNANMTSKAKKSVQWGVQLPAETTKTSMLSADPLSIHKSPMTPLTTEKDMGNLGVKTGVKIVDLCSAFKSSDSCNACLGYLPDDEDRHHELCITVDEKLTAEIYKSVSLEQLLTGSMLLKPLTRKQRFRLASILASSVVQLQTTPWLPNKLGKKDIFFYYQGSEVFSEHPFICHSFTSTKVCLCPEHSPKITAKSAQHFATRGSLENLGILLLELCFGTAIENRPDLRTPHLVEGKAHNQTNYLAARDWIYEVGEEAGLEFENAIKCCVLCSFDVKPDWADTKFTQSVYMDVVEPLGKVITELGWSSTSVA